MGVKTGIEHIDTNIIVRMITGDNPDQLARAEALFAKKDTVYVFEDAAMMEVVFVLAGAIYRYSRIFISESIKRILALENLCCNKSVLEATLDLYASHPKLSFVDCYLAILTDTTGESPLWTFDHKLAAQCPLAREA